MAKKATKIEKFKRVRTVSNWILKGHAHADICHNVIQNWGLSEAQAKRYIKEAYKLFKEEALIELSESKAFHLKARIEQYKDLVAERDKIKQSKKLEAYKRIQMIAMLSNQINSILRDMAKIDGLFVHKVEHTGKDGSPIQFLIPSATEELGSDIIE